MESLETMQRQLAGVEELMAVVKTMKTLAAVNIRQYERAVASIAEYEHTVRLGLHVVLHKAPEILAPEKPLPSDQCLILVMGTDQGMVGPFNDLITGRAVAAIQEMQTRGQVPTVWACGLRVKARLERMDCAVSRLFDVPTCISAITTAVRDILVHVENWHRPDPKARVLLIFNRHGQGAALHPNQAQLLPVNRPLLQSLGQRCHLSHSSPTFTMDPVALLTALIRQFFFVTTYRALAESLAAENATRLAAMQVAEKNIAERLDELRAAYHRQRQSAITEELMDVIAGFEALSEDNADPSLSLY